MPFRHLVFEEAQTVIRSFLRELDARFPGTIRDVYLVGSIALGEPRPGRSDIDIVLVRPEEMDNAVTMAALQPVLADIRTLYPEPALDGIILSPSDLVAGPDQIEGIRPVIVEGVPELRDDGSQRNPVTWATLRQCGITWRGAPLPEVEFWQDPDALVAWTHRNLDDYWRPWLAKSDHLFTPGGRWSLTPDFIEWGVLGVTRLHATIATGQILSKYQAGTYALENFPDRWHRIVREAMRIRAGEDKKTSPPLYKRQAPRRRKDARVYIDAVIADARRRELK